VQVGEVADAVGQERAGLAALFPVRVEHEVVDQQLTAALEQVEQAGLAVRALEDVFLVNLDDRQLAPLSVQRVSLPGEFLLLRQQRPAGGQPLIS
jgi:hypothetical protein